MLPIIDTIPPPPPNEPAGRYTVHVLVDLDPQSAPPVPRDELAATVRQRLLAEAGEEESKASSPESSKNDPESSTSNASGAPNSSKAAGSSNESENSADGSPEPTVRVDDPAPAPQAVTDAASQTWDWPGVAEVEPRCRTAYSIHHNDPSHDRNTRLIAVRSTVAALLDVLQARGVEAVALYWEPAQRLVHPAAFRESLGHGGAVGDYAINVRLFAIPDGGPDERLMDTRGLAEVGLPDLQCRFVGLPPGAIATHLMSYAEYLFDKGDVIGDGDVVRGLSPDEEWECTRGHSLSLPAREVLDIRPEGHAAAHPE